MRWAARVVVAASRLPLPVNESDMRTVQTIWIGGIQGDVIEGTRVFEVLILSNCDTGAREEQDSIAR